MKKKEFDRCLQELSKSLYSFTYALLSDHLQVSQIIMDVMTILYLDRPELIRSMECSQNGPEEEEAFSAISLSIYKSAYGLVHKRVNQLKRFCHHPIGATDLIDTSLEFPEFDGLSLEERATLFLKMKTNYEFKEIAFILSIKKIETFQILANGKNKISQRAGLIMPT